MLINQTLQYNNNFEIKINGYQTYLDISTGVQHRTSLISQTPLPTPQTIPSQELIRLQGAFNSILVTASRDPAQDGKLNWTVRLTNDINIQYFTALLPGLTIPYAWIAAAEDPIHLPDGLHLVGTSSFTASVALNFTNGEEATIHHSSPGVSLLFGHGVKRDS